MNTKYTYISHKKYTIAALILFSFLFTAVSISSAYFSANKLMLSSEATRNSVVRLHIKANSDSIYDQNVKYIIRNALLKEYSVKFAGFQSKADVCENITEHVGKIENFVNSTLNALGCTYTAKVSLSQSDFPQKSYGFITLANGEYTALKVDIGLAKGQNWWCVLYPPLCLIGVRYEDEKDMPEADKSLLTKLCLDFNASEDENFDEKETFKIKSIIGEWLKELN